MANAQVAHVDYKSSKHYAERTTLFENSAPIDSTNIVMIGNSLTENCGDWNELIGDTDSLIINRGIIGDTAYGIRARLCQILPGHPRAIFLMCGTNDLSHKHSAEEVFRRITVVADSIRQGSPTTKLFIQSLLPFDENSRWKLLAGRSKDVPVINAMLREYCDANGITFVNIFPLLCEDGTYTLAKPYSRDGLHITRDGYRLWASEIRPHIERLRR